MWTFYDYSTYLISRSDVVDEEDWWETMGRRLARKRGFRSATTDLEFHNGWAGSTQPPREFYVMSRTKPDCWLDVPFDKNAIDKLTAASGLQRLMQPLGQFSTRHMRLGIRKSLEATSKLMTKSDDHV